MEQQRIKSLIDLLQASDLSELTLSEAGCTLTLARQAELPQRSPSPVLAGPDLAATLTLAEPPAPAAALSQDIPSPLYGILHLTPAPGEAPFVTVGQRVEAGAVLCIVEAMKMFHQVQAPHAGVVEALLAEAGSEVDAGQPVVRIGG
ncbi:MAG: acetyl-CoA carboxylase biotin carboxyl carrier protein subunit [Candidatus Pseudomonas phytovorans]|uniref:Biotin carboxyl carrier protein of acetyl-CoA carboxylase n=1 Tax=Candidatus Pseudomonas phytovorans TaxID=3121377 RepID=A0AAJ6BE30_9PSED|nr:acetyl-CoA carboxylase biotin carboxyl carrier protein subunit [Pseudomonas sp.]WEK32797.1 MAG: acetyl-CoA carboxylase biotin carboxyl carrier protein subunit [Pseudomonas sp.]